MEQQSSVIALRQVLENGGFESCGISAIDLILLIAGVEDKESWFASQLAKLQVLFGVLRDDFLTGIEEFNLDHVIIKPNMQIAVVLLHCLALAAPGQMKVDA